MAAETATSDSMEIRDEATAQKYCEIARKAEDAGDRLKAIEAYEAAFAVDPENPEICFRLAYNLDLVGEEDEAIHLYEQVIQDPQPLLNALVNLAILYEDRGQYAQAERCIRQVLNTDPNHERARLYAKDILASREMIIIDDRDRGGQRYSELLETPVTDFDLSVRTRNSLRKMNVRTLGDLLRITEADLHNYNNFSESSIEEIKSMLAQRGLRLGQNLDQQQESAHEDEEEQENENEANAEALNRSLNELPMSVRARKALAMLNLQTIGDLCAKTEAELMGIKNFGMTSLIEIKESLSQLGLSLRKMPDSLESGNASAEAAPDAGSESGEAADADDESSDEDESQSSGS